MARRRWRLLPTSMRTAPHVEWPTALAAADPEQFGDRVVFTTDAPFAEPAVELARVTEAPLTTGARDAVLGGTFARLLGL